MAVHDVVAPPVVELDTTDDPVAAALDHVAATTFAAGPLGRVGLELELHLVDLGQPGRRPTWEQVQRLVGALPAMPRGSSVTVEPGGQLELSTPVAPDVVAAVADLAADEDALRAAVRDHGYGLAALGTDPARAPQRINPAGRYGAMERHFDAVGCVGAGRQMMTATAALQINLDAGPPEAWSDRLAHLCRLVPVLVALSSTSPWLGGSTSGWHSMRQGVWQGIDPGRTALCPSGVEAGDPARSWAAYALDAPVMLVEVGGELVPVVGRRVSFREWLRGEGDLPHPPRVSDLDRHLTTLFPPVRPRGYLELRGMDAMPRRWWPAMAAVASVLADDPVAAVVAAEVCGPVAADDGWVRATRDGLADAGVRRAATACLDVALDRSPAPLRHDVEALRDLVVAGSSPAQEVRARIDAVGPEAALREACDD